MPVETSSSPSSSLPTARALERQIQRGEMVRNGSEGAAVREAQTLLKAHGFDPGRVDGDMGRNTTDAVRRFQTSRGIRVDGVIGPETMRELRTPTTGVDRRTGTDRGVTAPPGQRIPGQTGEELRRRAQIDEGRRRAGETQQPTDPPTTTRPGEVTLAPRNMTESQKFDHYASIIRANGGEVNPGGKPTVLGIRGMDINGNRHGTTSARAYDDTFVVLTADRRVLEVRGATHAGQNTSSLSRDGNGTRGVGMINPGNFTASPNGNHNGAPSFHVTQNGRGNLAGVRDTNGDGRFSDAERAASDRRRDSLTGILFHQGFANSPKSIGCLTLSPNDWQRVLNRVGGRGFNFSLVQA
jgi:peptidoglycan hydrolase-like protein with peptidoglycan-binding domain